MAKRELSRAILGRCDEVSQTMKSLAHPVRLKILCCTLNQEQGVNDLAEFCGISQSAMSQFLKRMKAEGVLASRRDRNFVFYRVSDRKLLRLLGAVKKIYC